MGHGLFDDDDESELSDAPPSPPPSPKRPTPKPTPAPRRKSAPSSTTRPALSKKRTYQQRKRPQYPQPGPASSVSEETPPTESEADEPPRKIPVRRKRGAASSKPVSTPAPKRGRLRASTLTGDTPSAVVTTPKAVEKVEARLPSFLTKAFPVAMNLAPISNAAPRADVWSYLELSGLTWVRLDVGVGKIADIDQAEGSLCWWPGEVTLKTTTTLKITLCGSPPGGNSILELSPSSVNESNILTFRRPNNSSVRFPSFKHAYVSTAGSSSQDATLEVLWKAASARAFEIDTESNDGLEDICLLFSQQTRSTRDDSTHSSADAAHTEDEGNRTDEDDVLENDTAVLCRYRTRYYPAKIACYFPRDAKRSKGRYRCTFADNSSRIAARHEIHTLFDSGFATCALGSYEEHKPDKAFQHESKTGRAPTPEPRASSPAPEPTPTIDTTEYCARERMRDQLRPVFPFLQNIISRTYSPVQSGGDVLDRHAAFMQGGRARKNLAFSVHTGDLNEDDCEDLMHEISRWALRGERWAGRSVEMDVVKPEEPAGCVEMKEPAESMEPAGPVEPTESIVATEPNEPTVSAEVDQSAEVAGPSAQIAEDVEMEDAKPSGVEEPKVAAVDTGEADNQILTESTQTTEDEDSFFEEGEKTVVLADRPATAHTTEFHRLVQLQPPRPTGAPDYEQLAPGERMGYVSDVLYPEAAALLLSFRRGIRTHPGPVDDAETELRLYQAGLQEAKNTTSKEDWVDQLLATRQLREMGARRGMIEEEQVVVSGGTRSRPKYMLSKTGSILK